MMKMDENGKLMQSRTYEDQLKSCCWLEGMHLLIYQRNEMKEWKYCMEIISGHKKFRGTTSIAFTTLLGASRHRCCNAWKPASVYCDQLFLLCWTLAPVNMLSCIACSVLQDYGNLPLVRRLFFKGLSADCDISSGNK